MNNDLSEQIDNLARQIISLRKHPILILYYYEFSASITDDDVRDIYDEFKRSGWSRDNIHEELDVLIHCYGGNADASYRVGQIIHDFSENLTFLVPFHAASGATLICLGGKEIKLGAFATLSPIDIRIGDIELASIESFKKFACECRKDIEKILDEIESDKTSDVESILIREMVSQETALRIGSLYRLSNLTGHYANMLMHDYMFKDYTNGMRQLMAEEISKKLLWEYPSHDFVLDYHMAVKLGLPVTEMNEEEYSYTKSLVELLDELVNKGIICKDISINEEDNEKIKAPFFKLYT